MPDLPLRGEGGQSFPKTTGSWEMPVTVYRNEQPLGSEVQRGVGLSTLGSVSQNRAVGMGDLWQEQAVQWEPPSLGPRTETT